MIDAFGLTGMTVPSDTAGKNAAGKCQERRSSVHGP